MINKDKTEVRIFIEGVGEQKVSIPTSKAVDIYITISNSINEAIKVMSIEMERVPTQEVFKEHVASEKAVNKPVMEKTVIADTVVEKKEVSMEEAVEIYERTKKPNPFMHGMFEKPKLVAYRCPECGEVTVRFLTLADSNETYCHFCKAGVTIDKIINTDIDCPCCGVKYYFYTGNFLDSCFCKECKSPIDIVYTKDNKKGKSANIS